MESFPIHFVAHFVMKYMHLSALLNASRKCGFPKGCLSLNISSKCSHIHQHPNRSSILVIFIMCVHWRMASCWVSRRKYILCGDFRNLQWCARIVKGLWFSPITHRLISCSWSSIVFNAQPHCGWFLTKEAKSLNLIYPIKRLGFQFLSLKKIISFWYNLEKK